MRPARLPYARCKAGGAFLTCLPMHGLRSGAPTRIVAGAVCTMPRYKGVMGRTGKNKRANETPTPGETPKESKPRSRKKI